MARSGRLFLSWLLWFVPLFWLWMLLVGEWDHEEWIAGATAAAIAAAVAEGCRRVARVEARPTLERLAKLPMALAMVLVDFGVLAWLALSPLWRRERVRGRFIHRGLSVDAAGGSTLSVGRRALTILIAGYSPNAYVVDIDGAEGKVVLHDLKTLRKSEEPA